MDPLIAESFAKRFRIGGDPMFGGGGGGGGGRGRGRGAQAGGMGGGNYRRRDMFRMRQQNTSRPPSMHVDDFVAIDSSMKPRKMDNRMLLGQESSAGSGGGTSDREQQQQQQQQPFMGGRGGGGGVGWTRGAPWNYPSGRGG